jgi:hypothetical protein
VFDILHNFEAAGSMATFIKRCFSDHAVLCQIIPAQIQGGHHHFFYSL